MQVFDLHAHILPGLDDGPATIDDTVAMLHRAWEGGTRAMVATSHLYAPLFADSTFDGIRETFETTRAELAKRAEREEERFLAEIEIYPGAEHYCDSEFLEALERGDVLPVNGGKFLLVEFPTRMPEATVHQVAIRILQAGYVPLLAHVERYQFVQEHPERLETFINMGCLAQVNAGSVTGSRFSSTRRLTHSLLKQGLVEVIASDGHGAEVRQPDLGPAAEGLVRPFGEEAVRSWTWDVPGRVVGAERA